MLSLVFLVTLMGVGKGEEALEWWQKTVFYQIYPQSFYDSNGDGIGDVDGIKINLEYLEYLGVKGIWLNPVYKSPMISFGYDILNYIDIDPIFGSLEGFKDLMKELRSKGIHLIMDFVPNHSSNEHIWFEKSRRREDPYTDYYVWANGTGPNGTDLPNNWLSIFGGPAWKWDTLRGQFYLRQFVDNLPDLNYHNKNVREEMKNVLRFWLNLGVDGFRIDALKYLVEDLHLHDEPLSHDPSAKPGDYKYLIHNYTTDLPELFEILGEWREVMNEFQNRDGRYRVIVVESTDESLEELTPYFGNETYPLADMPFNFDLLQITSSTSAREIHSIVNNWLNKVPGRGWPNWVLGNHDVHRIANRTDVELIDAFNMLSLLLKGTPFTYYGEEIGMVDTKMFCDETEDPPGKHFGEGCHLEYSQDPSRSPMQWNSKPFAGFTRGNKTWFSINENYQEVNVETEKQKDRSCLNIYKQLVALRGRDVFIHGAMEFPYVTNDILSFVRILKDHSAYLLLINFGQDQHLIDITNDGNSSNFQFPLMGDVEISSGNIPEDSPLATRNSSVPLSRINLGKYQSVVIKFEPLWYNETAQSSSLGQINFFASGYNYSFLCALISLIFEVYQFGN